MADPVVIPNIPALKSFIGQRLGPTEWKTIGQDQIDAFARATGDHQWIHVDIERARRESPFGGTIAHGYFTLSLVPALLPELVDVQNVQMAVNSGIEKMRLPAPVPAGSRVRMSAEYKHVREMPGGRARATIAVSVEVEGGNKPACIADVVYLYFP